MSSFTRINRTTALRVLIVVSIALALPLASFASQITTASLAAPSTSETSTTPNEPKEPKTPKEPKQPKPTKPTKQSGLPSVSTGAGHPRGAGVELEGTIDPNGEAVTSYYFQYGPTTAYGAQTTPAALPAGTTKVKVGQIAAGLQAGYHYRLVATNNHGTKDGRDRTYTLKTTGRLKITLVRPRAAGQVVGSAITIEGALSGTGVADHDVVLQASPYPYKTAFTTVGAPQRTNSAGRFSMHVAHLTQSTRFQVVTIEPRPAYSPMITELATVRVTLHFRSAPHSKGLVRLYGTVSPAKTGAHVLFQLQKAARHPRVRIPRSERAEERAEEAAEAPRFVTKFSTTLKRATKTMSRFSAVVSIRQAGSYRAFVALPPGPLAPGASTSVTLQAAPKKRDRRKS